MSFRDLYNYAQTVEVRLSRKTLHPKILQITGVNQIKVVKSGLDTTQCRGMYLSLHDTDHHFIRQNGCRVIVLARALEKAWERFVYAKEIMHLFDEPISAADTGDKFETLLTQLAGGASVELSPATKSEINCFWMALSLFCPEGRRLEYKRSRSRGEIDHYTIASQLRIPELYAGHLLSPEYDRNIERILASWPERQ